MTFPGDANSLTRRAQHLTDLATKEHFSLLASKCWNQGQQDQLVVFPNTCVFSNWVRSRLGSTGEFLHQLTCPSADDQHKLKNAKSEFHKMQFIVNTLADQGFSIQSSRENQRANFSRFFPNFSFCIHSSAGCKPMGISWESSPQTPLWHSPETE